jgi:hypothetical protein
MFGAHGEFPSDGDFRFVERMSHIENRSREIPLVENDMSFFEYLHLLH